MNIAPYYKAVISGLSMVTLAGTGIVSLAELVPSDNAVAATIVGVAMSGLAVVGTISTYLIRNETAIETAVDDGVNAGEAVWHEIASIKDHIARTPTPLVEPYKAVAPSAQPVTTAPSGGASNLPAIAIAVEDVASALARNAVR